MVKYSCEIFNCDVHYNNIDDFTKILNDYAADGWVLDKVVPQIDSSSSNSSVNEDFSVDCCTSVSTGRNILIFKKGQ